MFGGVNPKDHGHYPPSYVDDLIADWGRDRVQSASQTEIFSLGRATRNIGFRGGPSKKAISLNDQVKNKTDIAVVIAKGATGTVVRAVSTEEIEVQFDKAQGVDFDKPVKVPLKALKHNDAVGEAEQYARTQRGGQGQPADGQPVAQGIGEVAKAVKDGIQNFGKKKLNKGEAVVVAKKIKIVIPAGTVGKVTEIVDNKSVGVQFRRQGLAIQEPIEVPAKHLEKVGVRQSVNVAHNVVVQCNPLNWG